MNDFFFICTRFLNWNTPHPQPSSAWKMSGQSLTCVRHLASFLPIQLCCDALLLQLDRPQPANRRRADSCQRKRETRTEKCHQNEREGGGGGGVEAWGGRTERWAQCRPLVVVYSYDEMQRLTNLTIKKNKKYLAPSAALMPNVKIH